jgi:hypothetical protein
VQPVADLVVGAAVADELGEPGLELAVLLAELHELPLGDRYRMALVRMRDLDLGQPVRVLFEEFGMVPQVFGDGL